MNSRSRSAAADGGPYGTISGGYTAPAHPGMVAHAPTAGVDTGFDLGRGLSGRSTPTEVLALFNIFNKCYNAGHNATVRAACCVLHVSVPTSLRRVASCSLPSVTHTQRRPPAPQVTVLVLLFIVLSPFVGMVGGIIWVFVRVLGTVHWAVAAPSRRVHCAHVPPVRATVLPLVAPLADVMRIFWGNEGSLWVELQKQRIRHFEREATLAASAVVASDQTVQV